MDIGKFIRAKTKDIEDKINNTPKVILGGIFAKQNAKLNYYISPDQTLCKETILILIRTSHCS